MVRVVSKSTVTWMVASAENLGAVSPDGLFTLIVIFGNSEDVYGGEQGSVVTLASIRLRTRC